MPLRNLWRTSFSEWRAEFARQWEQELDCPDPRFYTILESPVIRDFGWKNAALQHWLLLGHDVYFEVIGTEFTWQTCD